MQIKRLLPIVIMSIEDDEERLKQLRKPRTSLFPLSRAAKARIKLREAGKAPVNAPKKKYVKKVVDKKSDLYYSGLTLKVLEDFKHKEKQMKEMIKVEQYNIGGDFIQTVNARDLHSNLQVGSQFSHWINGRIEKYGFEEGKDFTKVELTPNLKMSSVNGSLENVFSSKKLAVESTTCGNFGQQGRIEFAISIGMAKELAMIENNYQGKLARKYFIQVEKDYKAQAALPVFDVNNANILRNALLGYTEKVIALENVIKEQEPKVQFHDAIADNGDLYDVNSVAKLLGMGANKFFAVLRGNGYLHKNNTPMQAKVTSGLMFAKVQKYKLGQELRTSVTPMVTGKGLTYFQKKFASLTTEVEV